MSRDVYLFGALPILVCLGVATYELGENIYRPDGDMSRPEGLAGTATTMSAAMMGIHNFVFPATIVFAILYAFAIVKSSKSCIHRITRPVLMGVLVALDFVVMVTSSLTSLFQKCNILGCTFANPSLGGLTFGGNDEYADDYNMPQSYRNSNALIYFFTALVALPPLTYQAYVIARVEYAGAASASSPLNQSLLSKGGDVELVASAASSSAAVSLHLHKQQLVRRWLAVLAVLFFLLPTQMVLTSRLGNNFQWAFPYEVATWAAREIVPESNIGYVFQYRVSADIVLKLFPDVVLFYGYIYVNCFFAIATNLNNTLRNSMYKRHAALHWLTLGEAVFWVGFVLFLATTFSYWYLVHGWEGNPISAVTTAERFSRTAAQVALAMMGLMVLPVARNSMWQCVFGISWEAMLRFHRVVARAFLICSLTHMFSFWVAFSEKGVFPQAVFGAQPNGFVADNETISVMSVLFLFFVLPIMGVLTLEPIRRKYFELFYFSHFISMVLFCSTLWHAASAWYFLLPGLALWAADHALRFTKSCETVTNVTMRRAAIGVTEIRFNSKSISQRFEAGQYIFLHIPELSYLEFHPFTLSSSPLDDTATCHVKSVGAEGQFSTKLYGLAASGGLSTLGDTAPVLTVDGPYGHPTDLQAYSSVLLVAGGIGITPAHSLLRTAVLLSQRSAEGGLGCLRRLRLVWVAKEPDMFGMFTDTFDRIRSNFSCDDVDEKSFSKMHISFVLYCTGTSDVESSGRLPFRTGRCDVSKEVEALAGVDGAMVFACGPAGLVESCDVACRSRAVTFRSEVFLI